MGIDIYAHWKGQSDGEIEAQREAWTSIAAGDKGYLREAYHGEPYATEYLCAEAFESDGGTARIDAALLRKRLPKALAFVEERNRRLYKADAKHIEKAKKAFRDFVALCEEKQRETREQVLVIASY